jgi:hypothetical protein
MTDREFERYCAKVLKRKGFRIVGMTKASHDQGADIIAKRFGKKYAIQCKLYSHPVGNHAIQEVYADWQDETGVKVIAISIDQAQNIQKVKPLVDGNGWEFDILLDPNSDFKRAMGVNMIPHVFIIDGKGNIAESRSGYTEGGEEHLIEKVRELIAAEEK